jgi:hypothetical protein
MQTKSDTPRHLSWAVASLAAAILAATILAAALPAVGAAARRTPTPPVVWAAAACGALNSWQQHLSHRSAALVANSSNAHGAAAAMVAGAVSDTTALERAITNAGAPASPNGTAIERTMLSSIGGAKTRLHSAETAALRLPANQSPAGLGRTLTTQVVAVGQTFIHLGLRFPSQTFTSALDQVPTCALVHG